MKIVRNLLLIWAIIGLTGCGRMIAALYHAPYDVQSRRQAQYLLETVLEKNPAPETFKGIGNIAIVRDNQVEKGRIAWMASGSDKLRIELLSPYGQPGVSFSSDGKHVYIVVHSDKLFYKKELSESSLKQFLSISVRPEEIIALFLGRPPKLEYSFISMIGSEKASEPVLVLQEKWWKGHQKIYPDKKADYIRAIEVYKGSGELKYRAEFSMITTVDEIRVPYRLEISNGEGTAVELLVSRFWPHAEILRSSFVLIPPE
ncbi:MAG: hypothetical protein R6U27_13120 [Desulfobacterales bacterium]